MYYRRRYKERAFSQRYTACNTARTQTRVLSQYQLEVEQRVAHNH